MKSLFQKMPARTMLKISKLNSVAYMAFIALVFALCVQPQNFSIVLCLIAIGLFMLNNTLKNITYKKLLKEESTKSLIYLLDKIATRAEEEKHEA